LCLCVVVPVVIGIGLCGGSITPESACPMFVRGGAGGGNTSRCDTCGGNIGLEHVGMFGLVEELVEAG
jgi:hypothetical protein